MEGMLAPSCPYESSLRGRSLCGRSFEISLCTDTGDPVRTSIGCMLCAVLLSTSECRCVVCDPAPTGVLVDIDKNFACKRQACEAHDAFLLSSILLELGIHHHEESLFRSV